MKKNFFKFKIFFLIPLFLVLFGTCGVEDYYHIYPVPQSSIFPELNSRAVVRIDGRNSGNSAFQNYIIFYCIYVGDANADIPSTISSTTFNTINPTLAQNHNTISPYIDSETLVGVNLDNLFRGGGRRFRYLELEGANIDSILSAGVFNSNLVFSFASNEYPTMTAGGNTYRLMRSTGNRSFTPQPDRFFVNTEALSREEFINDLFNADVVNRAGLGPWPQRITFAAMYIAAMGYDLNTHATIYSTPSLIHVFRLPNAWN